MQDRVRLNILGISYNQLRSDAFALILAQEGGPYRIPVVIGRAEAQSISLPMEHVTPPRPLVHDLFISFAQAFGVRLKEVFIYKFEDGIFSSELTFTDGDRTIVLDSRTSDAVAIAIRCGAPIWTTHAILEQTGFIIENDPTVSDSADGDSNDRPTPAPEPELEQPNPANLAIEELEKMLARLIENEDYEEAARISEILKNKKSKL